MAFVKPTVLAAAQSNPDAVQSRLVNFLLMNELNGPMSLKVAKELLDRCQEGFVDHFAAELLNAALGEGSLVGTAGRGTTGEGEEPGGEKVKKIQELAFHVAATSG